MLWCSSFNRRRWTHGALGLPMVLVMATASFGEEPAATAPDTLGFGWRYTRLDLDVTIHPQDAKITVEGKAELRLENGRSMGPTLAVNARRKLMQWTRLDAPAGAKTDINGIFMLWPPARLGNVRFEKPVSRGAEVEVSFAYESTQNASQFHVSPGLAIASWVECWYPVPAERPDSQEVGELPLAMGTTRIHMPASWRSVSDGALVGREEADGGATETWNLTVPVKRSFAAGPYEAVRERFGEREVGVYLLTPKPMGTSEQAKALADSIAAMESRFGPYPYPSYSIAEVPDDLFDWHAASQQSFILAESSAFEFPRGNLPLFAHEAAHGWWGNLIAQRGPGSILCSESLAQYSAVIAIEAVEGEAAATEFLRFSRPGYNSLQCARGYFEMAARGEDMPLSQLGSGGWQHNLSDAKGHWVYHMLRRRVGDELFFDTMRGLIRAFAHKAMSLDDVRAAFIKAAPQEADLERFFAEWLDRPGAPILEVEWSDASEVGRHQASLSIRQVQKGEPYHLRLDVAVDSDAGDQPHSVESAAEQTRVTLAAKGPPTGVRLDPQHRLLIWTPEYGDLPATLLRAEPMGQRSGG